ncbi:MAG TPA: hypothetical protein VNQ79_23740 [Blastocatellia bacterium]|nr:hypothetical protein [Blastocatellia bacterium]
MGGSYRSPDNGCGDLMAFLQSQRSLFESDEDFRAFALDQVRRFVRDLRALDIEVSMRPNWNDRISSVHSTPVTGS